MSLQTLGCLACFLEASVQEGEGFTVEPGAGEEEGRQARTDKATDGQVLPVRCGHVAGGRWGLLSGGLQGAPAGVQLWR